MRWSDVSRPPTDRKLREFAAVGALVCAALAVWQGFNGHLVLAGVLTAILMTAIAVGVWKPRWLAPVFIAAMVVTFPIAWLVSLLTLAAIFYGLIAPTGLVFRLFGRDVLDRRMRPEQNSYWQQNPSAENPRRYLRQY